MKHQMEKGWDKVEMIECRVEIEESIKRQKKIEWINKVRHEKDSNIKQVEWLWVFIYINVLTLMSINNKKKIVD